MINITEFQLKYMQRNESWIKYRLGDMFVYTDQPWMIGPLWMKKHYPNSIATQYMLQSNFTSHNYSILMDIVNNKTSSVIPSLISRKELNETLMIHLRTGDVIDRNPWESYGILAGEYPRSSKPPFKYYRSLSFYKIVLDELHQINNSIKKAIIITGFHKKYKESEGVDHSKSMEYISGIGKFFEYYNFTVSIRVNLDPDADFVLMCNARYFVKSGGGYSRLIADIVRFKNGTVFGYSDGAFLTH